MNLEDVLNAVNDGGHKWTLFRQSKPSKKKIIAALIAWSQSLSKQLAECSLRERELHQENGDLRCVQTQIEERLDTAAKQVTQYQGKEIQLEQKLSKFEKKTRDLEGEVVSVKRLKLELELSTQQLQNDIQRLEDDVTRKTETTNHITDALEKCRHDCQNKETRYLTLVNEKARLEDKLRAAEDGRSNVDLECRKLRDRMKTEESKQRQLEKDLATTRQVLNESYRDKQDTEKRLDAAVESLKYQIFTLGKSLHQKRMLVEKLRNEKELLMAYYQNKLYTISQNKKSTGEELIPPYICLPMLDKSVQTSALTSTTNTLKNKILDLEFRLYRHEKLTEALCDIIQSHDPNFVLEEDEILKTFLDPVDEILKTFLDPVETCLCDKGQPDYLRDMYPCSSLDHAESDNLSSYSNDTCATADSPTTEDYSIEFESKDTDDADTSLSYSYESCKSCKSVSTVSSYGSDFPANMSTASSLGSDLLANSSTPDSD